MMQNFGLATTKKILETITTKYVADKLPKNFTYHIDNDYCLFNEICARLPHIKRSTLRQRLSAGWCHWETLGQPPRKVTQKQRDNGKHYKKAIAKQGKIAYERYEYFKRKKAGHAVLD